MAFDKNAYDNEFKRGRYDRLSLLIPKGKKAELKDYANARGKSINALIVHCIEECTKIDLFPED